MFTDSNIHCTIIIYGKSLDANDLSSKRIFYFIFWSGVILFILDNLKYLTYMSYNVVT